jgi:hypothetical protein
VDELVDKGVGGAILVGNAPEVEWTESGGELEVAHATISAGVVGAILLSSCGKATSKIFCNENKLPSFHRWKIMPAVV